MSGRSTLLLAVLITLLALPELALALITPTNQVRQVSCSASTGDFEAIELEEGEDSEAAPDLAPFDASVAQTVIPSNSLVSGVLVHRIHRTHRAS